jgi:hypothetical protein
MDDGSPTPWTLLGIDDMGMVPLAPAGLLANELAILFGRRLPTIGSPTTTPLLLTETFGGDCKLGLLLLSPPANTNELVTRFLFPCKQNCMQIIAAKTKFKEKPSI